MTESLIKALALAGCFAALSCVQKYREPESTGPLPPSAFRVAWKGVKAPSSALPGGHLSIVVAFQNVSDTPWPDPQMANPTTGSAGHAVRLGYRWLDARGKSVVSDYSARVDLPFPIMPNQMIELPVEMTATEDLGMHQLQFDLVQEGVSWFEQRGNARLAVPIEIREPEGAGWLPPSAFRLAWKGVKAPASASPGSTLSIVVGFQNVSGSVWPDPQLANPKTGSPARAVRLGYRWLDERGQSIVSDYGTRFELPFPVAPNQSVELPVEITAPEEPGKYQLQFDLVQELVAWFEARGNERLLVPIEIRETQGRRN